MGDGVVSREIPNTSLYMLYAIYQTQRFPGSPITKTYLYETKTITHTSSSESLSI